MMECENQEYLQRVKDFATAKGKLEQLEDKLAYLSKYACHDGDLTKTRCLLFPDWAPASFYFIMEEKKEDGSYQRWFNGGLIYHGDQAGWDPTREGHIDPLSVTLTPQDGWSIHT